MLVYFIGILGRSVFIILLIPHLLNVYNHYIGYFGLSYKSLALNR